MTAGAFHPTLVDPVVTPKMSRMMAAGQQVKKMR
jgi:hypothetical protein